MPDEATGVRSATDYRDIADALRGRVDLFGKSLGAIATAGIAAVGLGKFGDLFPAGDDVWWAVAACFGIAVAAFCAIGISVKLMRVARPVFMQTDYADLEGGERENVEPVYKAAAHRFGYASLEGLELRERSLRRAAARATDDGERARRTALADEVKTEIEQALARGQVVVVRKRATDAVSSRGAITLYVAVIAGLILFAIGTNKVANDRNDPIAKAKACGEARTAGATPGELGRTNDICDGAKKPPPAPSAAEARAELTVDLAGVLKSCIANATKSGPLSEQDCAPLRTALIATASRP